MKALPTPCLLGTTGSGKTSVALHLARATQGEIVACDAFSIYRGLAILSAAPDTTSDVPHHLVGLLSPAEHFSAAAFTARCDALVAEIEARGHTPWIVGGSALYLRSWLKGFGAPVARDPAYRRELEAEAEREGPAGLHARLAAADPSRAAELHPNDRRRVIRALEILRATGRPPSAQRQEWSGPDRRAALLFGLRRESADLDARIARRTASMFEQGVVEEARLVLESGLSKEARRALGLDTLARHLRDELDADAAAAEIVRRTRRYARKQRTFFASFENVHWIDVAAGEPSVAVAERILAIRRDQAGGTSA